MIRPSLIWCDQRSQAQVDAVNAKLGRENVLRYIANPVLTGFTLPKLLWVRDHEPQHFERVRKLLLPKDYVRFRLTGEFATEVSDASGTALFDVVNRRWSFEMMDALGLDRADPARRATNRATSPAASRREAAELTGLAAGTPVVGGGGDQAAERGGQRHRGSPASSPARWALPGVVFAHMDEVAYDPAGRVHTFCHAVRDKWHVMGVTQGAGLEPAMVPQPVRARRRLRRAHRRSRRRARRRARPLLAALPDGRAHPASGRHRARRMDRPHRQPHSAPI